MRGEETSLTLIIPVPASINVKIVYRKCKTRHFQPVTPIVQVLLVKYCHSPDFTSQLRRSGNETDLSEWQYFTGKTRDVTP